ncbi:MAG: hypothetical protein R3254_00950 [Thiomicrorhabdus sp.]|nr:hypothetical protein [Thiomicrorhabdus sp.]
MAILRIAKCSVCGKEEKENGFGDGWQGWGALKGIALDGDGDVMLCPAHLTATADYVDSMKQVIDKMGDCDGIHKS